MANTSVDTGTVTETVIREPGKYKVILHNDDITTFDFVIKVLQVVFLKSTTDAAEIAKHIHLTGSAIVGVYTKEVAEEKVLETTTVSRANNYPLVATTEEV